MEALGSHMNNKYAEGYPGNRYYGGNEFIDQSELLCQKRALEVFGLSPEEWGVNVQPLSGSPANFAVFTALLAPHSRIMGLDLPHGGHLSHGFMSGKKRVSATSVFFESFPYRLDESTGLIDYDALEKLAATYHPQLIIAGASAYCRDIDYARFRDICDKNNAYLHADIAHISGLLAAKVTATNPFDYSDVVTTTTHKTLRGPRGGMIFYRKGLKKVVKGQEIMYDLEDKINWAIFPALQGGPHQHQIAAISVALKEAQNPEFVDYQRQVLANAKLMSKEMQERGYSIVSGGTDVHMFLLDLRPKGIDGSRVEKALEESLITVNKNTVPGDTKPLVPSGLRIGAPAITTRGMKEKDCKKIAEFLDRGIQIAVALNNADPENKKRVSNFEKYLHSKEHSEITALREEVKQFASQFPLPGC